ncbi:AAA family ATPase [Chitinophaga sp. 22321]|uniref:AAA family ATPase n=1 Tax=Chitinophaga hostae TaxID=2831022 RepID=A0ABS5IYB4_9BACT|nr:AAA family ATPase [Chitinophaga hostae]MBS0027207.1 AAA family ATPase [Chitinophaga hostae]
MFKINKVRAEILTDKSENIADLYGFDFSFKQGLNIIAGPNSRGKTTINTCIYYGLGMEELLGAHNEKALDKALKEEFTIKLSEEEDGIIYKVLSSKIVLEIENENNEIVCLERYIKSNTEEIKTSNIIVHQSSFEHINDLDNHIDQSVFFVNSRGNNEDPNGFFNWLTDFINIQLPKVSNSSRSDNYSPLYLQTIFSALLIEQTKGWSDFFATMPFFGITKAKEKIVEFILGLNEIELSTQKDVLNKEKSTITEDWRRKIKSFSYLEKQNNATIINVPEELTTDKTEIEKITVLFSTSEDERIGYDEFLGQKSLIVRELENRPISTIRENRESAILEFNEQKEEYFRLKDYIERFENKLRIEKQQFASLSSQLNVVESEIKDHINLQKVFSENIINERGANYCPTCSQEVTTNLISTQNITIPQLTLEENTSFLRSQKKIIESSIGSLKETVSEKDTLLQYFKNSLRQKEILIKALSKDLIADDRAFSESEVVRKLQLEREIENLQLLKESISELKKELETLANKYHNNNVKIGNLGESEEEDGVKLSDFETQYKNYLFGFGYESNEKYQISINRKEPFKYFPVYKNHRNDITPQSIRINSSASDFVRNIWAYTLGLLKNGINHPGIIIFDEPGQHRTNLSSLKSLFKVSSSITEKQTIIFTSIDKPLHNEENEKIDLDILIEDLDSTNYKLIRLDNVHKVIGKL